MLSWNITIYSGTLNCSCNSLTRGLIIEFDLSTKLRPFYRICKVYSYVCDECGMSTGDTSSSETRSRFLGLVLLIGQNHNLKRNCRMVKVTGLLLSGYTMVINVYWFNPPYRLQSFFFHFAAKFSQFMFLLNMYITLHTI